MKLAAALDLSGAEVAFALADLDTKKVLTENFKPMRGRDSAGLLIWMQECADCHDVKLTDVVEWTVGTGPGSFTGLRLVAALISGFTFQKPNVKARTLPSVYALGMTVDVKDGSTIASLHDGRRSEVLFFGMTLEGNSIIESGDAGVLVTSEELEKAQDQFELFTAVETDRPAIVKAFGEELSETVHYKDHLPISELIFIESNNWNEDMTDLVYIRPAVFIQPRVVREL